MGGRGGGVTRLPDKQAVIRDTKVSINQAKGVKKKALLFLYDFWFGGELSPEIFVLLVKLAVSFFPIYFVLGVINFISKNLFF